MAVLQPRAILCILMSAALAPCIAGPQKVIYVDPAARGLNDGSSWQNAYVWLQDALTAAGALDKPLEIHVAQGTYKPDQGGGQVPGDREATFQLLNGVSLQGGYAGLAGADPNARDVDRYETILSGDVGSNDIGVSDPCDLLNESSRAENSYHVVTANGVEPNAVIDGFTITAGYAAPLLPTVEPPPYAPQGGGMYIVSGDPTVVNCRFAWNLAGDGGAIHADQSDLILRSCTFSDNMAGQACQQFVGVRDTRTICWGGEGGAIRIGSGTPAITACTLTSNSAKYGGAISSYAGSPALEDCLFVRNDAYRGGGIHSATSWCSPKLIRCTFRSNVASRDGGAMANVPVTDAELVDCAFVDNWANDAGGAISNGFADLSLIGCTFTRNRTPQRGGAIYNRDSKVRLFNCLLNDNIATSSVFGGGATYSEEGNTLTLVNCTLVGNSGKYANAFVFLGELTGRSTMQLANCITRNGGREIANKNNSAISIAYTNITGGWPGEGNMDADPCFAALGHEDPNGTAEDPNDDFWVEGDYHLKSQGGRWDLKSQSWVKDDVTSPCIDAGDPNSPLGQEPFPNGGRVNMGAYGGTAEASRSYFGEPLCETVIAGDINGDCKVDSRDLAILARHWLASAP